MLFSVPCYINLAKKPCERKSMQQMPWKDVLEDMKTWPMLTQVMHIYWEYPPTMQPPAENKANLTSPFGPTSDPVVQAILSQPLRELESWVRGCPRSDLNHQGRRKFRYERSKQTRVAPMMLVHSKGTSTPQNAKSKVNWGRFVWDFFGGEVSSSEKSSIGGFGNLKTKLAMVPWRNWMVQWLKGLGF